MSARSFTFKESKKPDPKRKSFPSIQAVQLCTIDKFIARYGAPCPNYLKIDVPGFTQEILAAAWKRLANPAPRQIQVETKESEGGRRIAELLAQLGFKLVGQKIRHGREVQRELVFARDISSLNAPTVLAPGASTEVGYRRGRRNLPGKLKVLSRETRFISGR
jgi:hypothetical protein